MPDSVRKQPRPAASPAVLAIDIGTSSSRAAIHNRRGNRLAATIAQFAYPLQSGADGRAELDPAVIAKAVQRAVEHSLAAGNGRKGTPLAGIGISCFWHSMLGLNGKGRPLTPIYTWADSRCRKDAQFLREKQREEVLHARTGCMLRTSFWPAKLLWLRKTNPRFFRRVARWVSPAERIQEKWCGSATASAIWANR